MSTLKEHTGVESLCQVIGDTTLTGTAASVAFTSIESGYEVLILEWSEVYGDQTDLQNLQLTLVSGAGGYDHSRIALGTASSTTNAADFILIGACGDTDGVMQVSSGKIIIFNRAANEKVVIGAETYFDDSAGALADDVTGYHIEGKDRDTASEITTVTIAASAGNFAIGSRFTLKGLKTSNTIKSIDGVDMPLQLIGRTALTGDAASVSFASIPSGYGELILMWSDAYSDQTDLVNMQLTLVSGAGGYDYSRQAFGTASGTTNAGNFAIVGICGDTDGVIQKSSGLVNIFNRTSQEKVIIGTEAYYDGSAGALADDVTGYHIEAKDRDTASEISTVTITPSAGNFVSGSLFLLFGIKI